jgi:hypothetical protein
VLARLEYAWYREGAPHLAPRFAARAVLPSLLIGNVRAATTALRVFTSALVENHPTLGVQDVSSARCDARVFPSLPLLNFLTLLLLAVQRGSRDLYLQLADRYRTHLEELNDDDEGEGHEGSSSTPPAGWDEALEMIAEMYFGIVKPRRSNPLMDMMGSLFGSAGGAGPFGGGGGAAKPQARRIDAPAAEGLD